MSHLPFLDFNVFTFKIRAVDSENYKIVRDEMTVPVTKPFASHHIGKCCVFVQCCSTGISLRSF